MSGLWYGVNPFAWTMPTGATVLDLVNTEGVRFDRLLGAGTAPVEQSRITPRALRAHVKAEIERWGPILKKAGVNAE